MRVILWILQAGLAAVFLAIGSTKVFQSPEDLVLAMPEFADFPGWLITIIGILEIAGALGLILPAATRIAPVLTPLAAIGLAVTMASAAVFHTVRGEYADITVNLAFLIPLAFVAWARLRRWKITPRRTLGQRQTPSPAEQRNGATHAH